MNPKEVETGRRIASSRSGGWQPKVRPSTKMSDNAESPNEPQKEELHSPPEESMANEEKKKIDVLLKAVGDTPIMKTKKWAVDRSRTVQSLSQFISRFLKLDANEQLFIYVNQSFAPSPDQEVGVLFDCFGSDSKLVLHYCKSQAWG
ncbi:ubiquitin-like protein ATG12 isoform X1 [Hippocampus comes]|uniref:Ubiquitin-like protein ATG12 n=1 Tax=Hippocampus comes TaxID=109280 RepID=A0A3Q2YQ42_HIPCM|nr:PREDICTED: ubiquitin-like protein ATG12 isoform X1 [Hippocampus comes]